MGLNNWNTNLSLEHSDRKNQDYHFRLSVAPNIFHWKDPKTPAPFTPKPEFTQFVGKWKAPSARGERNGEVATSP